MTVTVASYRQTVLTAFQEVRTSLPPADPLSGAGAAGRGRRIGARRPCRAGDRYKYGVDSYLTSSRRRQLLSNQRTAMNIRLHR